MSTGSSNSKVYEDGELWSFIRRCMAQGKDIHLDHAERTYEEYSARLDVAALERLPELQAYIVRAVVAARGSNETSELLSIACDLSTMDCFWSASGHHEADCKCLSGRAERAIAAHTQKASE